MKLLEKYDPFYPDDDGEPMSDNTLQSGWIVKIFTNLEALFGDDPDVFVARDHLIYPVQDDNTNRVAPDVYVAFGRPKGERGSYKVWDEDGVFPQVVFEITSPSNRAGEMARKLEFYERYGAEEYYIYDPNRVKFEIYRRQPGGRLARLAAPTQYVSPRLGVYFEMGAELVIYLPDGAPFTTLREQRSELLAERQINDAQRRQVELLRRRTEALTRSADELRRQAEAEAARAASEAAHAASEAAKVASLREALRAAGIDPDTVSPPG